MKKYQKMAAPDKNSVSGLQEVIHFRYQRMIRYGGRWNLETRAVLPGYVFLFAIETEEWKQQKAGGDGTDENRNISLKLCEMPFLRYLCPKGNLIGLSRGIIKQGIPMITSGPLKGREHLIQKIDRHKRIAEIEIPLEGRNQWVTVGLEIYEKEI